MKSNLKLSDGLYREIEVEVSAEKVDAAFAEACHKYRKEAQIPGFRQGRAPLAVVKSKYRDAIYQDVLEGLFKETYPAAVREQNLDVISFPTIPHFELQEGKPLKYVARVEVMPIIEKIDTAGLEIPKAEISVSDANVDSAVTYLRRKHAEYRTVDREAQNEDTMTVDLFKRNDPANILKGDEFKGNQIDLSSSLTIKEFREQLPGMKAGDEKEITVNYPDDYSDELFAGKTVAYLCRVVEIKERILPEISDAFAKQAGLGETMLELRLKIRADMQKQQEREYDKWKRNEIIRQMVARNPLPIPESMIKEYLDRVVKDHEKNYPDFKEEEVREHYRPAAVNWIGWNLLSHRLAEMEKIELLPTDTENWIKNFAEEYHMELDRAKEILARSGRTSDIRESILEDKVLEFLLSKVTYVEAKKADIDKNSEDNEL